MNTAPYQEKLEAEKKVLERELAGVGKKNPGVPNDFIPRASETGIEPDLVDQADVIKSYEENEGIERDLESRYDAVLAALARLADGSYGTCAVCGAEIEKERLDADPAAATCIAHVNAK